MRVVRVARAVPVSGGTRVTGMLVVLPCVAQWRRKVRWLLQRRRGAGCE